METATHAKNPEAISADGGRDTRILKFELIRIDGGTQTRASISEEVVGEYAELMKDGVAFPPVVVFYDGTTYWLADGFHRMAATRQAGKLEILAEVRSGALRDALLHSLGANKSHGLQRSNADKRRAIEIMLADEEWCNWSDREIGRRSGTSHHLVAEVRQKTGNFPSQRTYRNGQGKVVTMNVAGIGKSRPSDVSTGSSKIANTANSAHEMPSQDSGRQVVSSSTTCKEGEQAEKGRSEMEPFVPPAPPTEVSERDLEEFKTPDASPTPKSDPSGDALHTEEEGKEGTSVDACLRVMRRGLVLELPDGNPKTIRSILADICTHPKLVPALKRGCLLVRIKRGGI